ncbi:Protein ECT2 [Frankliniella fusca]|uniref:Protein ECT2 n=1 Tax=Frankliniella fusca TaxID=407009 RepID=A0AAE1GQK4_9NEOP|nr:Protein ECT2 [Frankliniella fusca]
MTHPRDDRLDVVSLASMGSMSSLNSVLFSCVRSSSTLIEEVGFVPRQKICLIGKICKTVEAAAEHFGMPVVKSETGLEYLDDPSVLLVVDDFTPESLVKIGDIKWRVVGSVALTACANADIPLPVEKRPIFCFSMRGVVTCFTGIRDVTLAMELMALIRAMGGSVREKPELAVTHIISLTTKGSKYLYATTFNVPIMSPDWVRECWNHRFDPCVKATDGIMMQFRLKPFVDVLAAFIGFPQEEHEQMVEQLCSQGGTPVEATDPLCTHLVVDDGAYPVTIPSGARPEAHVVRADWFWMSIQDMVRQPEDMYPVPEERFRHPPLRRSVRRRPTGPMLPCNKENEEPVDISPAAVGSPTPVPGRDPTPSPYLVMRKLQRRLSLDLTTRAVCSPLKDSTLINSPASPDTPDLFSNKMLTQSSRGAGAGAATPPPAAASLLGRRSSATCLPASPAPLARRARLSSTPRSGSPRSSPRGRPAARGPPVPPPPPPQPPHQCKTWTAGPKGRRSLAEAVAAVALTEPRSPFSSGCTPTRSPDRGSTASPRRVPLSLSRRGCLDGAASNPVSLRFGAFLELMHTEENYVGILDAILKIRDEALDETRTFGSLLSQTEAKMIFGSVVPIARTHHHILKELKLLHNNWTETAQVGQIFVKYSPDLIRDYAPYVTSFEDAKEALEQTSRRNPRFNAFLKVCRNKPECGRQELHELMIRPVQRLASCVLLLREIIKHTPQECPDRPQLETALESLSHVLSFINEDKRKMESLCKVFDVYNLIDHCPADVIASHRSLVVECEGVEVSEHGFGKQGHVIAFFVFTDVILVCKKKSKVVSMLKGGHTPGTLLPRRILKAVDGKPYKFLQMLPLSTVRKLVDVADGAGVCNAMGVVFRGKAQVRESCSYFRLQEAGAGVLDKAQVLERWSVALASHNCVADPARFVQRETAQEAGIETTASSSSEALSRKISRAAQMAVKTQSAVTNAFGLGKIYAKLSPEEPAPCAMTTFNSTSRLLMMMTILRWRNLSPHH